MGSLRENKTGNHKSETQHGTYTEFRNRVVSFKILKLTPLDPLLRPPLIWVFAFNKL